jgi:hypothetical protein
MEWPQTHAPRCSVGFFANARVKVNRKRRYIQVNRLDRGWNGGQQKPANAGVIRRLSRIDLQKRQCRS